MLVKLNYLDLKNTIKTCDNNIETDDVDSWELIPTAPNWAKKFSKFWVPGENNAEDFNDEDSGVTGIII